jgi:hypothetical protein
MITTLAFVCLSLSPLNGKADLEVSVVAGEDWRSLNVFPYLAGTQKQLSDGIGDPPAQTRVSKDGSRILVRGRSGIEVQIQMGRRTRLPRDSAALPGVARKARGVYEGMLTIRGNGPWDGQVALACAAIEN